MTIRYVDNGDVTPALEVRGSGRRALLFAPGWIRGRRGGTTSSTVPRSASSEQAPAAVSRAAKQGNT